MHKQFKPMSVLKKRGAQSCRSRAGGWKDHYTSCSSVSLEGMVFSENLQLSWGRGLKCISLSEN